MLMWFGRATLVTAAVPVVDRSVVIMVMVVMIAVATVVVFMLVLVHR